MQETAMSRDGQRHLRILTLFFLLSGLMLLMIAFGAVRAEAGDGWERDYSFIDSRTPEQLAHLNGDVPPPDVEKEYLEHLRVLTPPKALPSYFDWRDQEIITTIKDQQSCGSCWAFAAVAQIEAHFKLYYGYTLNLSEQQAIFCNDDGADCGGGWASSVYEVAKYHGMNREAAEPYRGVNSGPCTQADYLTFGFVDNWYYVSNQTDQIKTALLDGPVVTSLDGSDPMPAYSGGCYDEPGGMYTNHAVLIVGWDDRACGGNGAWIIKNSWGTDFGEFGYLTIEYGASLVGSFTRQIVVDVPPVEFDITGPAYNVPMIAGQPVDITWSTSGASCSTVDIYVSYDGEPFTECIADDVPNTGSFTWTTVTNATENLKFCLVADNDTRTGYGLTETPLTIIGYRTRYVSDGGSNTAPYDTPETAAHSLSDAVYACTGFDSVMVKGGEYTDLFNIDHTVRVFGGWNSDFSVRDPETYPTIILGATTPVRFSDAGGDYAGVYGLTFRNCAGSIYAAPSIGKHAGAIRNYGGSPTISDCRFETCSADPSGGYGTGGAIQSFNGSPVIEDCVFTGNRANLGGAIALFENPDAIVRNSTFIGNACDDSTSAGYKGGAVYIEGGSVLLEDLVFTGNVRSYQGGAVYATGAVLQMQGVEFDGNRASNQGGALSLVGGSIVAVGCEFDANTSGGGGGGALGVNGTGIDLSNVLFHGNQSAGMGGACGLQGIPSGTIRNCVLHDNASSIMFGGIFATGDAITVRNNIITANAGGGIGGGVTVVDLDFNDVWGNVGGDIIGFPIGADEISSDPLFLDAAAGDFSLALHSPCVDTGDPDAAWFDPDGSRSDRGLHGGPAAEFLAPGPISGLTALSAGDPLYSLDWDPSGDAGIAQYVVYACPSEGFIPSAAAMVGLVDHPTTELVDALDPAMFYTVAGVDADGRMGSLAPAVELPSGSSAVPGAPRVLAFRSVVPNPFNPSTKIAFDLPKRGTVKLTVYDMRGRAVRNLIDEVMDPGVHDAVWNGRGDDGAKQAAGVYLMRLAAGGRQLATKVVMAK